MKAKKIIGISAIVLLCAIAVFSGVVFVHQYRDAKNSVEKFDDLKDLIVDVDTSVLDKEPVNTSDPDDTDQSDPDDSTVDESSLIPCID